MRKAIAVSTLLIISLTAFISVHAQAPQDTLQHYIGKYKFPEGSVVTEVTVSVDNGTLYANSAIGNAELKKMETDIFEIVGFGGTATFKRNGDGKVDRVQIIVGDVNMEGSKTELGIYHKWTDWKNFKIK